ncbi:MAG: hypothetical protein Q9186_004140 [Xanthomendoza sp. 1 TL-2023]
MADTALTTGYKSPMGQDIKSLRILCFGDSLTAGFSSYGYFHYPYAAQIRKELKKALPATDVSVVTSGLSGDRVIAGQFLQRMRGMCAADEHPPYDWIIVLGGTNDLGWSERPDKVYEAVPYFNMNETMREQIWDDGLHLTMDGYEMMGEAIATRLIELLHTVEKPVNDGEKIE